MMRICESLDTLAVFAPQDVAPATEKASEYVDVGGYTAIDFHVLAGALAMGKKLTVALYCADSQDGANAEKVAEQVFTAAEAMDAAVAVVSARVTANRGGYYAVKFQHDAAAATTIGVSAVARVRYMPAEGWHLLA